MAFGFPKEEINSIKNELRNLKYAIQSPREDVEKLQELINNDDLGRFNRKLISLNKRIDEALDDIRKTDLREFKNSLDEIERRRENLPFHDLEELKQLDIGESEEEIINRILDEEETIREEDKNLKDLIDEFIESKKERLESAPIIIIEAEELEKFIKNVKEEQMAKANETGGVFHYENVEEGLYLDKFIHLPNPNGDSDELVRHNLKHEHSTWKMPKQKASSNNFVHAHSHPPPVSGGMNSKLSRKDEKAMEKTNMDIEILAVPPQRSYPDIEDPFIIPLKKLEKGNQKLKLKVKGGNGEDVTEEFKSVQIYNQILSKSVYYSCSWKMVLSIHFLND